MGEAVWLGILLGTGAAIAVGPIFVTVVQEALTHGFVASFRVILGATVADAILLIPALTASWLLAKVATASLYISLFGACFLIYLGFEAARDAYRFWHNLDAPESTPVKSWSFWKGVLANLLNPVMWIFWLTTGASSMIHVSQSAGWAGLILFLSVLFTVAMTLESGIALMVTLTRHGVTKRGKAILTGVSAVVFLGLAGTLLGGIAW